MRRETTKVFARTWDQALWLNRGDAMVLVESLRVFLPGSHMVNPGGASEEILGKTLKQQRIAARALAVVYLRQLRLERRRSWHRQSG